MQTTVDIPEPLHDVLRERADRAGTSIQDLIVKAIEQSYSAPEAPKKGKYVTGPLITGPGKVGPLFPTDKVTDDLIFP